MSISGTFNNKLSYDNSSAADDRFSTLNWGENTTHQYVGPSTNDNRSYHHPLNAGGPIQPYTGDGVVGGTGGFLSLDDPVNAPFTLYPANRMSPGEGDSSPLYPGTVMPTLSVQLATITRLSATGHPSAIPSLSCDSWTLPTNTNPVFTAPIDVPYALPQVAPNPGDLGFDFFTAVGPPTLPAVRPSSPYILSYEELWSQIPESGPSFLGTVPSVPIMGVAPPRIPIPTPVTSPSGPQRTGKHFKESRKYSPVRSTNRKADYGKVEHEDGWDVALVQFQAKLHDIVHSVQPAGGLSPELVLAARTKNTMEEELKRSPLRDAKAGEGRRPRDLEEYLTGILREIPPAKLAPVPSRGASKETNAKMTVFARLADVLEAKLVAVNQHPVLQCPTNDPQTGRGARLEQTEDRVKKNRREKMKRGCERHHLERISRLFKVARSEQTWTRVDVLIFAIAFLLHGPSAFSLGFVKVSPSRDGCKCSRD